MFLVSSLHDKLKKTLTEVDTYELPNLQTMYVPQKVKQMKPIITKVPKTETDFFTSEKLNEMNKTEWEKTFTLSRLRKKWDTKMVLNFDPKFKKINDKCISPSVLESRQFIRDYVDPDILLHKKKDWNNSVDAKEKKIDKQKEIFECSIGLNNYTVTKLKEKPIQEGTETRDKMFIDFNKWDNSFYVDRKNNLINYQNSKILDKKNTIIHWRKTAYDRENENQIPISPSRLLYESPRYYKKYRTPKEDAKYMYNTMKKVKKLTWLEREKAFKKIMHDNPGNEKNLEKINSLTDKYMSTLYKEKCNELLGKNSANKTSENFVKHWKDNELIFKIDTISNWKNMKWFRPLMLTNTNFNKKSARNISNDSLLRYNTYNTEYNDQIKTMESDEDYKKREILKPLVTLGTQIAKEEKKIKYNLIENYKKQVKLEMIKKNSLKNSGSNSKEKINVLQINNMESKYPMNKKKYLMYKNSFNKDTKDEDKSDINNSKIIDSLPVINNREYEKNIKSDNYKDKVNQKIFLQAYKNVTIKDIQREKTKNINNSNNSIEYVYKHPGAFRQFEFKTKYYTPDDALRFKILSEKVEAWSCCMNTDKNSQGCQKRKINRMRWNLTNI